jgi:hypothetical protein
MIWTHKRKCRDFPSVGESIICPEMSCGERSLYFIICRQYNANQLGFPILTTVAITNCCSLAVKVSDKPETSRRS